MMRSFFIGTLFLLCSCITVKEGEPTGPRRPKGVPSTAFWCGGADGGVFVELAAGRGTGTYSGVIYFDHSGEVWYRGAFQMDPEHKGTPPDAARKDWCGGWDGTRLHLRSGGALIATAPTK